MKKKQFFNTLIQQKIDFLVADGRYGTANNYRNILHYIEQRYGLVECSKITPHWATEFQMKMKKEGKSPSTINNYFSMITAIFNYGVYKGYCKMEDYPIQKAPWELDKPKKPAMLKRSESYLNKQQMQELFNHWKQMPTDKPYLLKRKKYVGLFLMSYLCNGANLADLLRLKYNPDYFNNDGKILTFHRQKVKARSNAKVTIPIIPQLKEIMDYLANEPVLNGHVLPFSEGITDEVKMMKMVTYTNVRVRDVMNVVGKKLLGREGISITYARHSYSTVLHHAGCNFAMVEQNLGHSLNGVAGNYIGQQTIDELFKCNSNLL